MGIERSIRQLALQIPRLRRVHDHVLHLNSELERAHEREETHASLQLRLDEAERGSVVTEAALAQATERADELQRELEKVRASLELRIYVLTSDHQRAVAALDRSRSERDALKNEIKSLERRLEDDVRRRSITSPNA